MNLTVVSFLRTPRSRIEPSIHALRAGLDAFALDWEVLLVSIDDDLSTAVHASCADVRVQTLVLPPGSTSGECLREGLRRASGDVVVTCDFEQDDASSVIEELYIALEKEDTPEVVLASHAGADPVRSRVRGIADHLIGIALRRPIRHWCARFRGYRQHVVADLLELADPRDLEFELLSHAVSHGMTIRELPVRTFPALRATRSHELLRCLRRALRRRPGFFLCAVGLITLGVGLTGVVARGIEGLRAGDGSVFYAMAGFGVVMLAGVEIALIAFLVDKLGLRPMRRRVTATARIQRSVLR